MLPAELDDLIRGSRTSTSFVVDDDGGIANTSGSSSGIGNQTDKKLLSALRANAQVVLTSGKTARLDRYRMPKTADLAIFTNAGVGALELKPAAPQRLSVFGSEVATDFKGALDYTRSLGYDRVHVEFGLTGFLNILTELDLVLISCVSNSGPQAFFRRHGLTPTDRFELDDLNVWALSQRG